jgi:hypothetical protein
MKRRNTDVRQVSDLKLFPIKMEAHNSESPAYFFQDT